MSWWYAQQRGVEWTVAPLSRASAFPFLRALMDQFGGLRALLYGGPRG